MHLMPFKLLKKPLLKRWSKIFLLAALFFITLIFINQRYRIKNIEIQLDEQKSLLGLNDYQNKFSFLLNEKKIAQELGKKNPDLEIIFVRIQLPETLIVKVKKNPGVALLKSDLGYFSLDSNGLVVKKDKELSSSLPLINYYQKLDYLSYNPGERIDFTDLIFCLNLITAIEDLGFQINSIDIQGTTMIVLNLNKQKKILVNPEKSVSELQKELNTIIKQLKIRGTDFSQLDLRFNRPVIIF